MGDQATVKAWKAGRKGECAGAARTDTRTAAKPMADHRGEFLEVGTTRGRRGAGASQGYDIAVEQAPAPHTRGPGGGGCGTGGRVGISDARGEASEAGAEWEPEEDRDDSGWGYYFRVKDDNWDFDL